MKKILFFLLLSIGQLSFCQMGIGTTTPRGVLDINNPTTSVFGLVLPTNADVANMQNPQGGNIAFGTIMYDSTDDCIKYYHQNIANDSIERWSPCIVQSQKSNVAKLNYLPIGKSFTSIYKEDASMTSANTFKIAVTNEGYSTANLTFSPSDLVLSGVQGITVTGVSPTTASLAAGATVELTYRLSGTPNDCGALIGTWKKADLEYTTTINVVPNLIYNCSAGSWTTAVAPEYRLQGLIPGQAYSGTYTIPYTGGSTSGCDIPAESITQNGLTLRSTDGPISPTGNITYTLSGIYTGANTSRSVTFVTNTGCTIYLGPSASCKEILQLFPDTPDGVYKIDPDKQGTTHGAMSAQCDMTTDGGGWTMILNYLHQGGTNPSRSIRTTLPLLGSSTLGVNEGGNTTYWGNANRALQAALKPTEYRFYGISSMHNKVMNFKTAHAGSITYFTTGVGSASGIQNSFTPLEGHTTNLPRVAHTFFDNVTSGTELLAYPFVGGQSPFQHFAIAGFGVRWETDDFANGAVYNTLHRVWVR